MLIVVMEIVAVSLIVIFSRFFGVDENRILVHFNVIRRINLLDDFKDQTVDNGRIFPS